MYVNHIPRQACCPEVAGQHTTDSIFFVYDFCSILLCLSYFFQFILTFILCFYFVLSLRNKEKEHGAGWVGK